VSWSIPAPREAREGVIRFLFYYLFPYC
jgi:hypothetical protein